MYSGHRIKIFAKMTGIYMLVLVKFLFFVTVAAGELKRGHDCQLKNGKFGVCKLILECPIVDKLNEMISPGCGSENTETLICCVVKTQSPPRPSLTPIIASTPPSTPKPASEPSLRPSRQPGKISREKCLKYSKDELEREMVSLKKETEEVSYDPTLVVISNGTFADIMNYPHMVQIGFKSGNDSEWGCGGILISEQYVLTAAHCLWNPKWGDAEYVRMGIVDLTSESHKQQFNIIERICYPEHHAPFYYHDIGLVKLDQNVELNSYVRPACLHTSNELPQSDLTATGWGATFYNGRSSRYLLEVTLKLFDQPTCNKIYRHHSRVPDGIKDEIMICAGFPEENKDTCEGDSGGPLQFCKLDTGFSMCDIVGVTSGGTGGCGLAPGIYTRVSYYVKWIEDIIWPVTV